MAELNSIRTGAGTRSAAIDAGLRAHMNKVYGTMSVGMLLTALVSWAVGSNAALLSLFYNYQNGVAVGPNILGWIVMFAPLGMVFLFSGALARISAAGAQLFFYAFSAVMGLSMAWIFAFFTNASIAQTFLTTSIAFAGLSLYGYTTKRDMSGMGSFLMMGLIGIIAASIIQMFVHSAGLAFAISIIGVLLFAALTAYDTQAIKVQYIQYAQSMDQEWLDKSAIMGSLKLYLDFINLFMFLLQFMGSRR